MKKSFFTVLLSCLAVFLLAACGGGGSSADCGKVCAKVGECSGSGAQQDCQQGCPEMAKIFRPAAWDPAVACVLDTPCATLDVDACLLAGTASVPDSVLNGLANTICNKIHSCDPQVDVETCKTEMLADEDTKLVKIFNDATLNCIGTCVASKDCAELAYIEQVAGQCACDCGVAMWCE